MEGRLGRILMAAYFVINHEKQYIICSSIAIAFQQYGRQSAFYWECRTFFISFLTINEACTLAQPLKASILIGEGETSPNQFNR